MRSATTSSGRLDAAGGRPHQRSPRYRAFLPAGLGTSDLTGRRDGDWLTGTGAAIAGARADRRRADIAASACTFPISVEGFAVAGLAGDLVGEVTVLFGAGRIGAIVFF